MYHSQCIPYSNLTIPAKPPCVASRRRSKMALNCGFQSNIQRWIDLTLKLKAMNKIDKLSTNANLKFTFILKCSVLCCVVWGETFIIYSKGDRWVFYAPLLQNTFIRERRGAGGKEPLYNSFLASLSCIKLPVRR